MTQRWRALAVAALLATALAPAASLPAEAPLAGVGAPPASQSRPAAGCDAQSMLPDPRLIGATDAACLAPDLESDQAYLVETARPGSTMLHQGLALAITRLHPIFVGRLAETIRAAREAGLPAAGIFSAYRPPAFGVGGFADKFNSLHSYGLAVDMLGIGGPGSSEAKLWHEIAARHGVVCPYGAGNRREWNHCQPTRVKTILAGNPLRDTVSPQGPIDLKAMFAVGDALVSGDDAGAGSPEPLPVSDQAAPSRAQAQPSPPVSRGSRASIATSHDKTAKIHERHASLKSIVAHPDLHEARGHPKHRIVAENPSIKGGPAKKYRISSLVTKRIDAENARVDRSLKNVCRGC